MFPTISLGFTFFVSCVPSYISLGFTFFFCVPNYISWVDLLCSHLWASLSSSPVFPAKFLWGSPSSSVFQATYLWGSPSSSSGFPAIFLEFTFFFCAPSYMWGSPSSSSVFPAISLGFIIFLLLMCPQLYLWGSPSSLVFPAISLGFTILLFLLCFQLYFWGSLFFGEIFTYVVGFQSNQRGGHILSSWMAPAGCVLVVRIQPSRTRLSASFESIGWNACVHRLNFFLFSHPIEF